MAESAIGVRKKLIEHSLNFEHENGGSKANAFRLMPQPAVRNQLRRRRACRGPTRENRPGGQRQDCVGDS